MTQGGHRGLITFLQIVGHGIACPTELKKAHLHFLVDS